MKKGYVYKITNPEGLIYIGGTPQLEKRIKSYKAKSCRQQKKLYASIIKHGFDNHVIEVVWEGDCAELKNKEREYGLRFNVLNDGVGLNDLLPGAASENFKNKIKESLIGNTLSEDTKRRISKNSKRLSPSLEVKLKTKKALQRAVIQMDQSGNCIAEYESTVDAAKATGIKRTCIKNAVNGISHSAGGYCWVFKEGGKKNPAKKVLKIDKDSENIICEFKSISEAARSVNLDVSCIRGVVNGRYFTAAGYKWKYA